MNKKLPVREAKDGHLEKAKRRIKRLEKENARLKSEVRTLEGFRDVASTYIDGKLDGVPVEKVIKSVQKKMTLKQTSPDVIKECCPECITAELKVLAYPGGKIKVCGNCKFRATVKDEI